MQQTPPAALAPSPARTLAPPSPPAALAPTPPPATIAPTPPPAAIAPTPEAPRTWKVGELVRLAGRALEARYADVWVEGEVSGLRMQQSGHAYFSLKDAEAVLPVVMFRASLIRHRFRLVDGLQLRVRGRLSIWPQAGKFQMVAEAMEPAGLGALQLAFEQLKRKLAAEGLFDEARKRRLPFLPRCIGVVTSPTGAAVRDIIRVAERRGPTRLLISPCLVQGEAAPDDIVRALVAVQQFPEVELVIVGRGGGSAEDLAAFNDERVARAIAACRVPVVSAVGHEIDFTIADFVADRRAATPSQAAEIAVPVHAELRRELEGLGLRVARAGRRQVAEARQLLDAEVEALLALGEGAIDGRRRALEGLAGRLLAQHPRAALGRDRARLAELTHRLERPLAEAIARGRRAREPLDRRLHAAMQQRIVDGRRLVEGLPPRLHAAMHTTAAARRHQFEALLGRLDALSPLRVLDRGYSVVYGPDGHVVAEAAQLVPGARVTLRFAAGSARATVDELLPPEGIAGEPGPVPTSPAPTSGKPPARSRK